MVSSRLTDLIYDKSAFCFTLLCATVRELKRWMDRENEMDGGQLCEWVETRWIEGSTLLVESTEGHRLLTRERREKFLFFLPIDR